MSEQLRDKSDALTYDDLAASVTRCAPRLACGTVS